MRGHIRKRGKNSWAVVVELARDPVTRKRRQKWVTVKGSRKDAEEVLAQILVQAGHADWGLVPSRMTVGEYLDKWLEAVRSVVKPTTAQKYCYEIARLKPLIGHLRLQALTPADVQRVAGALPKDLAPATRRRTFYTLRAALRQAVVWGMVTRDPTVGVKPPPALRREIAVWRESEVVRFLEAAKPSRYYALFYLALATGMRCGELLGLTWEDVDFAEGTVHVLRTLAWVKEGAPLWQEPKTPAARRRIPLDTSTVEVLRQHRKRQLEERLKSGAGWNEFGLVFCTQAGRPVIYTNLYHVLRSIARRAGLRPIRFNDLRHTHATLLLRQGIHPKVVAERLGHSRVAVTLDTYSDVLPDTQAEAVKAMKRVLEGNIRSPR